MSVWGSAWRSEMAACETLGEWMSKFDDFAEKLCKVWQLPYESRGQITDPDPQIVIKLPTSIDELPPFAQMQKERAWDSCGLRLWVQTDNKQIADLFDGHAKLDVVKLRPLLVRIGRLVWTLLAVGWKPRLDTGSFIEWDPRMYNTYADHAANCALDGNEAWERREDTPIHNATQAKMLGVNFRLCFDGARRKHGHSAGGVALFAYYPDGTRKLLHRGGVQFGCLESSFLAEALTLEWALETFLSLITD